MLRATAALCAVLTAFTDFPVFAQDQSQQQQGQSNESAAKTLPAEQLDSLLAPIALYPDPLLSQILVASTYPLEIVQADRWLQQNSTLKDKALTEAAAKQSWDGLADADLTRALPSLRKNAHQQTAGLRSVWGY